MYKIYITYMKDNDGPYQNIFYTEDEALEWVRSNDIQITCIDRL